MTDSGEWKPKHAFEPRAIKFKEILQQGDWRLKLYIVLCPENTLQWDDLEEGIQFALNALPLPAQTINRPGYGFMIAHQGSKDFTVMVNWWDNEDELHHALYARPLDRSEEWCKTGNQISYTVWDMEILWFEREAYVNAILSKQDDPDFDGYIEQRLFG